MMKEETYSSLGTQLYEFISVTVCFVVAGAGIGVLQGLLAFRRSFQQEGEDILFGMSGIAALFGATVALFVGLCLYVWLGHRRTVTLIPHVVFASFITGIASAYILGFSENFGWLSAFITPIATVIAAIRFKERTQQ